MPRSPSCSFRRERARSCPFGNRGRAVGNRRHGPATGFTLIELLVTVLIVALLASVAMPLSSVSAQRTKEQELHRSLRELREAIDAYKRAFDEGRIEREADRSGYPPTLATLVE